MLIKVLDYESDFNNEIEYKLPARTNGQLKFCSEGDTLYLEGGIKACIRKISIRYMELGKIHSITLIVSLLK